MSREATAPSDGQGLAVSLEQPIAAIMDRGIAQGVFPGGVVLVRQHDRVVFQEAYGKAVTHLDLDTRAPRPAAAMRETVYDLASITKVFTATCTIQLVDEGAVGLDDPVARYLGSFGTGAACEVTVRHLLTHVSGLPRVRLWEEASTREARVERIRTLTPEVSPGSRFEYSDVNFLVLGEVIEHVDGRPLNRAIAARITEPLGLRDTSFGPVDVTAASVAATEDEAGVGRGLVHGTVHDENAWSLGVAGHAGLFGTAHDLSIFGQSFLNGGQYGDARLLRRDTVTEMTRLQVGDADGRGLGWQLNAAYYMGRLASRQTYGHTGFTGTSIVIDPRRDLLVVLLTNRVHPSRHGPAVDPIRRAVADAVLTAVDAA